MVLHTGRFDTPYFYTTWLYSHAGRALGGVDVPTIGYFLCLVHWFSYSGLSQFCVHSFSVPPPTYSTYFHFIWTVYSIPFYFILDNIQLFRFLGTTFLGCRVPQVWHSTHSLDRVSTTRHGPRPPPCGLFHPVRDRTRRAHSPARRFPQTCPQPNGAGSMLLRPNIVPT